MAPVVDGIEQQFGPAIAVYRLRVTDPESAAFVKAARVRGHPTTYVFAPGGKLVDSFLGAVAAERLEAAIREALAGGRP